MDQDYLKDKVSEVCNALTTCQRSLVVACERAEYYGQNRIWELIMTRTRSFFDALGIPTCDGSSLCRAMSHHRVSIKGGKRDE